MDRDQLDYGRSLSDNWKAQMLANLVKMRYVDMPVFVDVGQIVSGYSLETMVQAGIGLNNSFTGGNAQTLGASGKYTDRPTITYTPKTGSDYLRSLLEPVDPSALLKLILAGYSSELLFAWAVQSINGVHNYSVTAHRSRHADPEFTEYIKIFQDLQSLGAISFEMQSTPDDKHDVIILFEAEGLDQATLDKRERSREIISLDPDRDRFRVVYGPFSIDDDVIALQTRSVLQMLTALSGFIDVPPEKFTHASSGFDFAPGASRPFHVHSSPDRPKDSFTATEYKGYWYWIENDDLVSKRVFTLMLFLTTLTHTDRNQAVPVLTIPTG